MTTQALYDAPSGFVNFCGPSFDGHSSAILMQYGSSRDHQNLGHSEDRKNSQDLTGRRISQDWDADRTYLNISSKLAEPLCQAWGYGLRLITPLRTDQFDNFTSKIQEIAFRILIAFTAFLLLIALPLTLPTAIGLGIASKIFRAAGYAVQKEGFTHVRGIALEKPMSESMKDLTLNICGIAGDLSKTHGGPIGWRARFDGIIAKIQKENPDTILLQEVYDTALAERIIEKLGSEYAHFFTHLGPSIWGSEGGCMVITKHAYSHFSHSTFANSDWTLKRGFFIIELKKRPEDETPCKRIVGTHLIHGNSEQSRKARAEQVSQIISTLATRTLRLPTLIGGDLNIERDGQEDREVLMPILQHNYLGDEETCTNTLARQWNPSLKFANEEKIDYLSFVKPVCINGVGLPVDNSLQLKECHLVSTYEPGNTKTALSDHKGIAVTTGWYKLLQKNC